MTIRVSQEVLVFRKSQLHQHRYRKDVKVVDVQVFEVLLQRDLIGSWRVENRKQRKSRRELHSTPSASPVHDRAPPPRNVDHPIIPAFQAVVEG
jgi:hypothetical protein